MKTKRLFRCSGLLLSGFIGAFAASAATVNVNSVSALQSAINAASAGDVIVMANGTYSTSGSIAVNRVGAAGSPIAIMAETVGGVTIGGSGGFKFSSPAAYVTVQGFNFTH